MLKFLPAYLIALIILSSCSSRPVVETRPDTNPPASSPTPTPANELPFLGGVGVTCDDTCTDKEIAQIPEIEKVVSDTVNGSCFADFLSGPKNEVDPGQSMGLTPAQVVKKLQGNKVAMVLTYYYKKPNWLTGTGVVGYRNGDENIVHANRYYHDDYSVCDKGSNIEHEASHLIGFDHDFNATNRRPYSVPYLINSAFDACCKP